MSPLDGWMDGWISGQANHKKENFQEFFDLLQITQIESLKA